MKKAIIFFSTVFSFLYCHAQTDSAKCVEEINHQVWKPFIESLTSGNQEALSKLHSKRITRVEIDRGVIQDYEKYFPTEKKDNKNSTKYKRTFELHFDKRICNGTKAWETGFYKGTVAGEGQPSRSYYGRFFVVLEKENEGWKIVVDADTGKDATEENFNKARPLE
jgi:hypothetical protein